jgi:hypothetical protein
MPQAGGVEGVATYGFPFSGFYPAHNALLCHGDKKYYCLISFTEYR